MSRERVNLTLKQSTVRRLEFKKISLKEQGVKPRTTSVGRLLDILVESSEFDKIIEKALVNA